VVGEYVTDRPSVDFMILADRAEALNGKLYIMGGAWNEITVQDIRQPVVISFAVGILVPWNATNEQHRMTMVIEDADSVALDTFRVDSNFTAGRPPQAQVGEVQRLVLAVPAVPIQFARPGAYIVKTAINDGPAKEVQFKLLLQPAPPGLPA
jgi:hypothetical protein